MIRRFFPVALLFMAVSASAQVGLYVTIPTIDPGLPFEISVAVRNESGFEMKNVTVTVQIPPKVQVTGISSIASADCSQSGQTVTCQIADLPFVLSLPQKTFGITAVADDSTNGTVLPVSVDVHGPTVTGQTINAQVYRTIFVTSTAPDALGNAINQANAECLDDYPCKIAFRLGTLPEPGYFVLRPVSPLPRITGLNVSIDGTTQTRLTGDTNANGPEVYIDGRDSAAPDAIVFDEPCEAELTGLAIGNFRNAAVTMNGAPNLPVTTDPPPGCTAQHPLRSVHDNYLGVDPSGTQAAPNERGIVYNDFSQLATLSNNLISGNRRSGIWVGKAFWMRIAGNTIGLDIHHQPLGNGASGVYIGPTTFQVDVRGNYIAFNHDFGVAVDRKSQGTDIGPNSIFANWQLGIDVGLDGPTTDGYVPVPQVLSAQYDTATDKTVVTVSWTDPNGVISPVLTIYASDAPHSSGYGDGQYLLGTFTTRLRTVTFAANGDWRGKWVAATLTSNWTILPKTAIGANPEWEFTDTVSTTSEFSRAIPVQ